MGRLKDLVIDCADPWTLSHWWAETLEYHVRPWSDQDLANLRAAGIDRIEDDPAIVIDPNDDVGPPIWFVEVPEPKHAKNRMHLDIFGDVDALVARGAIVLDRQQRWTVMADPEGNEFCVFPPRAT